MFVKVRGKDDSSMVMYKEDGKDRFRFYRIEDSTMVNGFNYDFIITEKEITNILDEL